MFRDAIASLGAWLSRAAELPPPRSTSIISFENFRNSGEMDLFPIKTEENQLKAYAGWVYAAVSTIAWDISSNEWNILRKAGKRREDWQAIPPESVHPVFQRPNSMQTWGELREITQMHLDLTGKSFWHLITSDGSEGGKVVGVQALNPEWVDDDPVFDDQGINVKGWNVQVPGRESRMIPIIDMIFHRYPHPREPFKSASPVEAFALSYDLDMYSRAYGGTLLKNQAVPEFVIISDNPNLDQTGADVLRESVKDRHQRKPGQPMVVRSGVSIEKLGFPLKDLVFAELAQLSREQIFAIYKFPASKVGISKDVNRSDAEAHERSYETNGLLPRLRRVDGSINTYLMPRLYGMQARNLVYESVSPVKEDREFKLDRTLKLVNNSMILVNQGLSMLGEEEQPDGDVYLVPNTVTRVPAGELATVLSAPEPTQERSGGHIFNDRMEIAELKFRLTQGAQERTAKSKIRRQFDNEKKAMLEALRLNHEPPATITEAIKQGIETRDFVDETVNAEKAALQEIHEGIISLGTESGHAAFAAAFDESVSFDIFSKKAAAFAKREAAEKVVEITETTKKGVKKIIKTSIAEGHSTAKTARAISELYDNYKGVRAETIARTETSNAINWGQFHAADETQKRTDLKLNKRWVATIDKRTRDSHLQEHFDKAIPLYELFELMDEKGTVHHMLHPGDPNGPASEVINCFPAGTGIDALNLKTATRRHYEGELVEIVTAGGDKLAGTPNHPILTTEGWVALKELNKGDGIIRATLQKSSARNPNIENAPACIEQIFDALSDTFPVHRISGAGMDFHGDGISDSNVDIVRAAGKLRGAGIAAPLHPVDELYFSISHLGKRLLLSYRSLCDLLGRLRLSSTGIMSGFDLVPALSLAHSGPLSRFSLRMPSAFDIGNSKQSPDYGSGESVLLTQGVFGDPANVEADQLGQNPPLVIRDIGRHSIPLVSHEIGSLEPILDSHGMDSYSVADLLKAKAGLVEPSSVIKVNVKEFSGHIYNLETDSNRYIANNIITHNCRCTLAYVPIN